MISGFAWRPYHELSAMSRFDVGTIFQQAVCRLLSPTASRCRIDPDPVGELAAIGSLPIPGE
jgi:hypothetical protein